MKHRALLLAIGDAAIDDLKPLLAPLIAAELRRQRTGGDPLAPPVLPALARAADRLRIRTQVEWSAAEQLNVLGMITENIADAIATRVADLVRETVHAQRVASGDVQREFDAYRAEARRIPAEHAAMRATIARLKDLPRCAAEAQAREALAGLVVSMRAKRMRRGRADTKARLEALRGRTA